MLPCGFRRAGARDHTFPQKGAALLRESIRNSLALLFVQARANSYRCGWVNGRRVEIDMFDPAGLVDHKGRPPREFILVTLHRIGSDDSICAQNLAVHVAQ